MKKFVKTFTVALSVICTAVLGIGIILGNTLPSSYYVNNIGSESLAVYGVTLNTYRDSNLNTSGQLMLGNIIPIKSVNINIKENETVIPCGNPGIETGDVITYANSKKINCTEDLPTVVNQSGGNPVNLTIIRNNRTMSKSILPIKTGESSYKIGVWVRDSSAGIGTMTFFHPESHAFGGLGHGICDIDTGELMPMAQGEVTGAEIDSITKSKSGTAGTLNGHHCENLCRGYVISNCESGVFGYIENSPVSHSEIPIAYKQQVKTGKAQIITTLDSSTPKYYDIEIQSINYNESTKTKNIIIKITDSELLSRTNGIVQGMSGSPIIQNNRLVGAVTHVFVNEPQKGYGIFAENMIDDFNKENQKSEKNVA